MFPRYRLLVSNENVLQRVDHCAASTRVLKTTYGLLLGKAVPPKDKNPSQSWSPLPCVHFILHQRLIILFFRTFGHP